MGGTSSGGVKSARWALGLFLAAIVVAYTYFLDPGGDNQNSRLATVFAVVDHGTLAIDAYNEVPSLSTGDKSFYGGHYYSDKSIGTVVLGIPAYWAVRPVLETLELGEGMRRTAARAVVTWASVSIPTALAVTALLWMSWRITRNAATSMLVGFSAGLATPVWPFATLMFGHSLSAALLLAAFIVTRCLRERWYRPVLMTATVGLLLGGSVIAEYQAIVPAAIVGIYAVWTVVAAQRPARVAGIVSLFIGGLLMVGVQLGYNYLCFGSPWDIGYTHTYTEHYQALVSQGFMGINAPSLKTLFYITLHPVRGVLLQAPVLLLGLAGLWFMYRRPDSARGKHRARDGHRRICCGCERHRDVVGRRQLYRALPHSGHAAGLRAAGLPAPVVVPGAVRGGARIFCADDNSGRHAAVAVCHGTRSPPRERTARCLAAVARY